MGSSRKIYFDYAATTPVDPEVFDSMRPYFNEIFGNPSSSHSFGKEARTAVEKARESVAKLLGARPDEIVFTSGGTESNNAAIKGIAYENFTRGNHIITSPIEHHAVLEPCAFLQNNGFSVTYLSVGKEGVVNPDDVRKAITKNTVLISVMHANNEIGSIQPIEEIGRIAHGQGICFHTDSVQTSGHMQFSVGKLDMDLLSMSAHKLYGPKGVGALYIRKGTKITPFMHGGTQENGRRASTHNVPGIVGLGKAAELAIKRMKKDEEEIQKLGDKLINGIQKMIPGARINGSLSSRLPGNVNVSFPETNGELMVSFLNKEGIACSTGSACRESSAEPSHVLRAIGLSAEQIAGSLRFSLGRHIKVEDVDHLLGILPGIVRKVRSLGEHFD